MARPTVVISELDQHVIDGPFQAAAAPGSWRAVPYSSDGMEGVLLGCGERTNPAPVTIGLGVEGTYRVWLGLPVLMTIGECNIVRVRLSDDPCCTTLSAGRGSSQYTDSYTSPSFPDPSAAGLGPTLYEIHWKDADLTGQDLILEGAYNTLGIPGALGLIRLEPVDGLPATPVREVAHPLAMTEDGHGIFWSKPHRRPEDILESYANIPEGTAAGIVLWNVMGGLATSFPSQAGEIGEGRSQDYHRHGDAMVMRNVDLWIEKGWNSMQVARDYCRGRGWAFHIAMRVEAFVAEYPLDEVVHSSFYYDHPELCCYDAEGQRVARMSYACEQVQERILAFLDELIAYEPDGINLTFIRGLPLVLYEPVMVDGFEQMHGIDPRTLGEFDERWLAYQAGIITPFMRALKARLKPGMRLSATIPGTRFDNMRWGLDVETWVGEGIVDDLYPMGQRFSPVDSHVDAPDALDLEYFLRLQGRDRIRLFAALYPWNLYTRDLPAWRRQMASFLERGADGYCVWDGATQIFDIGDIGLAQPADIKPPRQPMRERTIQVVNGLRVDRYHPDEVI